MKLPLPAFAMALILWAFSYPGSAFSEAEAAGVGPQGADYAAALRLPNDPAECVAMEKTRATCLATAEDLNRLALQCVAPPQWTNSAPAVRRALILDIRKELALRLARDKFLHTKIEADGLGSASEARFRKGYREQNRKLAQSCRETRLDSLYRGTYAGLFGKRIDPELSVIASTDSQYLDSLARLPDAAAITKGSVGKLPWQKCAGSCLEAARALRVDTLPEGARTLPKRFPFGSAVFKVTGRKVSPAMSLEEAIPALCMLDNPGPRLAHPTEREARAHYDGHAEKFAVPDTLMLKVWLGPATGRMLQGIPLDTSRFRPRQLSHLELPEGPRSYVSSFWKGKINEYLHTRLDFGHWGFRILSVKPGRGMVPFEKAKAGIVAELAAEKRRLLELDALNISRTKAETWRSKFEEQVYLDFLAPTPEELAAFKKSRSSQEAPDDPDYPGKDRVQEDFYRSEFARERLERERQAWLEKDVLVTNLDP